MVKNELQGVISGTRNVTNGTAIQAITDFIRKSKKTGADFEEGKFIKEQETTTILNYAEANDFLFPILILTATWPKGQNKRYT